MQISKVFLEILKRFPLRPVIGVVVQIPKELPVVFQPVGKLRRHGAKSGHWHPSSPSLGIPKPSSPRCPPSQTMTETDCFMVGTNLHALALLVQQTFPPDLRPSPTLPDSALSQPTLRAFAPSREPPSPYPSSPYKPASKRRNVIDRGIAPGAHKKRFPALKGHNTLPTRPLRTRAPQALDCWENHSSRGARGLHFAIHPSKFTS